MLFYERNDTFKRRVTSSSQHELPSLLNPNNININNNNNNNNNATNNISNINDDDKNEELQIKRCHKRKSPDLITNPKSDSDQTISDSISSNRKQRPKKKARR
jgi:hypothetical protein